MLHVGIRSDGSVPSTWYKGPLGTPRRGQFLGRVNEEKDHELKYHDVEHNVGFLTGGTVQQCMFNNLVRGTDASERQGRDILITSLEISGTILAGLHYLVVNRCRIILYVDHQSRGGVTGAHINLLLDTKGGTTSLMNAFPKLDNTDRFSIFYDEIIDLNQDPLALYFAPLDAEEHTVLVHTIRHRFKLSLPVSYADDADVEDPPTGNTAFIRGNNIRMACIKSEVEPSLVFNFTARIRFQESW